MLVAAVAAVAQSVVSGRVTDQNARPAEFATVLLTTATDSVMGSLPLEKALQLLRSWFVGMPGESVSCVGCHEGQNKAPSPEPPLARRDPGCWRGASVGITICGTTGAAAT